MDPQNTTDTPSTHRLGSSAFTRAVRLFAGETLGVSPGHALLQGRLARRIGEALADGKLPAEQINGRYSIDPALVPEAARLLGLTAADSAAP